MPPEQPVAQTHFHRLQPLIVLCTVIPLFRSDALHLRTRLPEHMVPAAFVALPVLPLTPNGKVNRKALPEPVLSATGKQHYPPDTPVEEAMATIWAELLKQEHAGREDNFFKLGGQPHERLS